MEDRDLKILLSVSCEHKVILMQRFEHFGTNFNYMFIKNGKIQQELKTRYKNFKRNLYKQYCNISKFNDQF